VGVAGYSEVVRVGVACGVEPVVCERGRTTRVFIGAPRGSLRKTLKEERETWEEEAP
jgi:hypothetical protein